MFRGKHYLKAPYVPPGGKWYYAVHSGYSVVVSKVYEVQSKAINKARQVRDRVAAFDSREKAKQRTRPDPKDEVEEGPVNTYVVWAGQEVGLIIGK